MYYEEWRDRAAWKAALGRVVKRAERNDDESLSDTFVELGDLTLRMSSEENQILFGRRGTGKSHAFHHLRQSVAAEGTTALLIDLRTVGSAGGYYLSADGGRSLASLHIIVDLLSAIHGQAFEVSIQLIEEDRDVTRLVRAMDSLAAAITELTVDGATTRSNESVRGGRAATGYSAELATKPSLAVTRSSEASESQSNAHAVQGVERPVLNLGQIAKAICDLVAELPNQQMWLLLDEWSALPLDVQPVVADFIRRCLLPCRGMIVKIAAVERRSRFWFMGASGYVGLELGSDIGTGLDLDEYLARGLKSSAVNVEFYRKLVANHVRVMAKGRLPDHLADGLGSDYMLTAVFPVFPEAIYFAAGVPRDLLSISGLAASRSAASSSIDFSDLTAAARQFFLQEKEAQARVTRNTRALSSALRDYAEAGSMRFFVDRHYSQQNQELLELLDQRVIHLLDRAIGPRGKFDMFAVDLGIVADILSEDHRLANSRNPWANWDHVKTSQKIAPVLVLDDHRISWKSLA